MPFPVTLGKIRVIVHAPKRDWLERVHATGAFCEADLLGARRA